MTFKKINEGYGDKIEKLQVWAQSCAPYYTSDCTEHSAFVKVSYQFVIKPKTKDAVAVTVCLEQRMKPLNMDVAVIVKKLTSKIMSRLKKMEFKFF